MRMFLLVTRASLVLAVLCALAGCAGGDGSTIKERGVYTTLAMEGHNLDLPGSGYTNSKTFGPDQTPAAVVVGYGYWDGTFNHPQQFDLQVIETATGAVIFETGGYEYADKAAVIKLPIRKSGNYQLKLLVNNKVYDTWDFTVDRGTPTEAASAGQSAAGYAKGIYSLSIAAQGWTDAQFADYDKYLLRAVDDAVQKAMNKSDRAIFYQVSPGKVVISFKLDEQGNVSWPQIVENTLNDALAQFFLHALQDAPPYKPWSGATSARAIKITFNYD